MFIRSFFYWSHFFMFRLYHPIVVIHASGSLTKTEDKEKDAPWIAPAHWLVTESVLNMGVRYSKMLPWESFISFKRIDFKIIRIRYSLGILHLSIFIFQFSPIVQKIKVNAMFSDVIVKSHAFLNTNAPCLDIHQLEVR